MLIERYEEDHVPELMTNRAFQSGATGFSFGAFSGMGEEARKQVKDGGFNAWLEEGRPLTSRVPRPERARFEARVDDASYCAIEELQPLVERGAAPQVWDLRSGSKVATIQGKIKSLDTTDRVFALEDGTQIWVAEGLSMGTLKEGASVKASYEERDGKKVATSIEVK